MNKKKRKTPTKKTTFSTSKALITFLFINCTIIEFFTMYVTLK